MDNVSEIYVYENWKADTPSLIGTLYVDWVEVRLRVWLRHLKWGIRSSLGVQTDQNARYYMRAGYYHQDVNSAKANAAGDALAEYIRGER